MSKVYLKRGREDSLLRFHPWVFSGAIAQVVGHPAEGDLVSVFASDGSLLGCGHYQIGSIAVRMLGFGCEYLADGFWTEMVAAALSKMGYEVDKKKIVLSAPIKKLGVYDADIKLVSSVKCGIKLKVVQDN